MDLLGILEQLRKQRDQVNEGIAVLERIAAGMGRRRGRPPKWMQQATAAVEAEAQPPVKKRRGRPAKKQA